MADLRSNTFSLSSGDHRMIIYSVMSSANNII
jgi:hypothetical protein